jgi:hypothetical protein
VELFLEVSIGACCAWYPAVQVEIGIANGDVDGESRNYAKAAVGALVPLLTTCMAKQVGPSMCLSLFTFGE